MGANILLLLPWPPFSSTVSLHCPSSLSPRTTANNSVGVTYVNYPASAVIGKNFCNKHRAHVNSSHTTESVSKHVPLKQSEKLIVSKTGETERVRKCHREGCQAYKGERRGRRCREKAETRTLEETWLKPGGNSVLVSIHNSTWKTFSVLSLMHSKTTNVNWPYLQWDKNMNKISTACGRERFKKEKKKLLPLHLNE